MVFVSVPMGGSKPGEVVGDPHEWGPVPPPARTSGCGYYLRTDHRLIRRHEEALTLNPDNTAIWRLRVDLELPGEEEAPQPVGDGTYWFLFPLVFLRKNESRMQFRVYEEGASPIQLPTREECDAVSAQAIAQALNSLVAKIDPSFAFEEEELQDLVLKIPADRALDASIALQFFREWLEIVPPREEAVKPTDLLRELGATVEESGLDEALEMLVEHALLWIPLRGFPNERRSIYLEQEITLHRRSLVRWSFGSLSRKPKRPWLSRRWARMARGEFKEGDPCVKIAEDPYGRRDRRFSGSALGERIGQPLGWMPFEFELPTIYPKRCNSYHFEVRCPPGRTPRALKVAGGPPLAESASQEESSEPPEGARLTRTSRSARFDLSRGGLDRVARFQVIVGIGGGAFPLLWFLAGAITAVMLWGLAGSNPGTNGEHAQTTAGILLLVPALVAGLAAGSNEVPISYLIGGARILLLATGLSAVAAASVLAGARPFDVSTEVAWIVSAMAATATTVPLATSWLLSSSTVWRRMMRLDSYEKQKFTLALGIVLAAIAVGALVLLPQDSWLRAFVAAFLLALMIGLSALASNRAAMPIGKSRHYLGFSFLLAGLVCLGLACVELGCLLYERALDAKASCTAADHDLTTLQMWAELISIALLNVAYGINDLARAFAAKAAPREDEVHVSPRRGIALLTGESVRELPKLFERERRAKLRPKPKSEQSDRSG